MAIVEPLSIDDDGGIPPRPGTVKVKGAAVSALKAGPARDDIPEGAGVPGYVKTAEKVSPSVVPATEDPPSLSLSNGSSVGRFETVEDNWEYEEELTKEARISGDGPKEPVSTIWNSPGYLAYALDKLLIETYELKWFTWEPETLRSEIIKDFSTTVSDTVFEKIMATRLLHSSQSPWKEWDIFQNVCLALNDIPVNFDFIQHVSPAQLGFAMDQMARIRKEEFDEDIKAYIATICYEEGLVWLIDPLTPAQKYLDKLNTLNEDFKREIQTVWNSVKGDDLTELPFKEDKLGVQLSRLVAIYLYIKNKMQAFALEGALETYEEK